MIEIDSFVPRSEIDERYLDSPYYIGPNDPVGQEAFAVIREAMRGKDMVALGRVVLAKRERVIMLQPWEKGLMGTTLRYPYEVRDSKDYFYDIPDVKIAPDMLTLAEHILKSKETKFDPSKFVDRYEQAVHSIAGEEAARHAGAEGCSVRRPDQCRQPDGRSAPQHRRRGKGGRRPAKTAAATQPQKGKKRVPGQGELLLPIAGRKDEPKAETKPATQPISRRKSG